MFGSHKCKQILEAGFAKKTLGPRLVAPHKHSTMCRKADGGLHIIQHDGGFSLHAKVRIERWDREGLERLLRYYARPPFALERIEILDNERFSIIPPNEPPTGGRCCSSRRWN